MGFTSRFQSPVSGSLFFTEKDSTHPTDCCVVPTVSDSQPLLPGRAIAGSLLSGLVYLFGGEQNHGLDVNNAGGVDYQGVGR